jgi:hypothetical protein
MLRRLGRLLRPPGKVDGRNLELVSLRPCRAMNRRDRDVRSQTR